MYLQYSTVFIGKNPHVSGPAQLKLFLRNRNTMKLQQSRSLKEKVILNSFLWILKDKTGSTKKRFLTTWREIILSSNLAKKLKDLKSNFQDECTHCFIFFSIHPSHQLTTRTNTNTFFPGYHIIRLTKNIFSRRTPSSESLSLPKETGFSVTKNSAVCPLLPLESSSTSKHSPWACYRPSLLA